MSKMPKLEEPLNANERYLYAIAIRMDALCSMFASFLEHYANNNGIATTSNCVEEKISVAPEECSDGTIDEEPVKVKKSRKK